MKFKTFALTILIGTLLLVLADCKTSQKTTLETKTNHPALTFLQNNCFQCHSLEANPATKIAPSMAEIRQFYIEKLPNQVDFEAHFLKFLQQPSRATALMSAAVQQYGLMPKLGYKTEDLKMAAAYLYENDLRSAVWQQEAQQASEVPTPPLSFEELGLKYVNGTKGQLGKNLLAAIQKYGTTGAVEFCNTRAIPLTDSMANVYQIAIKRVSDLPRNLQNQANDRELAYIATQKIKLAKGEKTEPEIFPSGDKMVGYYTIETNTMCLQCHGKLGQDISVETVEKIKKLYPNDRAIGYGEQQIRGIWVVEMQQKQ